MLIVELCQLHRVTATRVRPQALLNLAAIVCDHRVGSVEDRAGGTIILLELDKLGVRKVLLEIEDVPDLRAAKAVDALGVVTNYEEPPVAG